MTGDDYWTPQRRRVLAVLVALLLGAFLTLIGWPVWFGFLAGAVIGAILW